MDTGSAFGSALRRVGSRSTIAKNLTCTVHLLDDDSSIQVDFKKHDTGEYLLNYVCDYLNVAERDFFGLRYIDAQHHRYWLDHTKPVVRQVPDYRVIHLAFRVKFYPKDTSVIKEELTRYLFVQQLRRDIRHGRLYCPFDEAAYLGAYLMQAELGDYNEEEHPEGYVSQFSLFPNQIPKLEEKIASIHKELRGLTPAETDVLFLKRASTLETYGFYPFSVKDDSLGQVYIGATWPGVSVYHVHTKIHGIPWSEIEKFDYVSKDFFIYLKPGTDLSTTDEVNIDSGHRPYLKFSCSSAVYGKQLWKYMLAQKGFFTCSKASEVPKQTSKRKLLFRKSTFRYSGRVLQEIDEVDVCHRQPPEVHRLHIQRQAPRSPQQLRYAESPEFTSNGTLVEESRLGAVKPQMIGDLSQDTGYSSVLADAAMTNGSPGLQSNSYFTAAALNKAGKPSISEEETEEESEEFGDGMTQTTSVIRHRVVQKVQAEEVPSFNSDSFSSSTIRVSASFPASGRPSKELALTREPELITVTPTTATITPPGTTTVPRATTCSAPTRLSPSRPLVYFVSLVLLIGACFIAIVELYGNDVERYMDRAPGLKQWYRKAADAYRRRFHRGL